MVRWSSFALLAAINAAHPVISQMDRLYLLGVCGLAVTLDLIWPDHSHSTRPPSADPPRIRVTSRSADSTAS
jgi:hypothetical protein